MTDYSGVIELVCAARPRGPRQVFFDETGKDVRIRQPFMNDTHGGGRLEEVAGFEAAGVRAAGIPGTTSSAMLMPEPADTAVAVPDTTALPFRCIAHLDLTYADGSRATGTGWFAAANTVVTAASCFFDPDRRLPVGSVTVTPGCSGGARPFLSHRAASIYVPAGWRSSAGGGTPDSRFDYALAYLAEPGIGRAASWFGLAAPPDAALDELLLNVAGYPARTAPARQCYDGGRLVSCDASFLYHRLDAANEMAGAPIFVRRNERRYAIGIQTGGNRARRIDTALFDEISRRLA